jgi:RHS repeat-associated protein
MVSNRYDTLDRLTAETTALGTVTYVYDALGRRTGMSTPGDAPVSYGYDGASRLTQILQAGLLVQLDYDARGRRTRLTLPNGVVTEYEYDGASRVTTVTFRTTTTILGTLTYRYDAAGNRIGTGGSLADTLLPEAMAGAVYDQRNRQLAFGNRQNAFDANGNLTSVSDASGLRTLFWDGRDRLVRVDSSGLTATFTYDAFGRRITRTVGAATTRYLHDGFDVMQEVTNGASVTYLEGLGVDQPFVRNSAESYLTDALGSVVGLVTPGGSISTRYLYTPFGDPRADGVASANPFQFTAREFDAATGLYYFRARYLDPVASRFIQEDAAPGVGTLPQSLNRYAYAFDNPQSLVDHDGRFPGAAGPIGGLIAGGIAGGISGAIEGGISGGSSGAIAGGFFGALGGAAAGFVAGFSQNLQLSTNTGAVVGNLIGGALGELFNPSTLGRGPGDAEEVIKPPPSKAEPEFRRPPDEKPEPEFRRPPGDLSAPK